MDSRILKIYLKKSSLEKLLHFLFSNNDLSGYAWEEFLKRYSKLILKVCWKFEKEYDKVMQQYLFVCEKLVENDFSLLKNFSFDFNEKSPKFTAWLIVVARNICIDYYRTQHGRKRYPAGIANLPKDDKQFFELYYWKGSSLGEISEIMNLYADSNKETAFDKLERINSLLVRTPELQLKTEYISFNEQRILPYEDLSNEIDFVEGMENWIADLSSLEKIIVRLRFWDGLTAREISEVLNISPYNKVYSILNKALKTLRERSEKEKYI